jgi:hypothetical protein
MQKSQLEPTTQIEILGFELNTQTFEVAVPDRKTEGAVDLITRIVAAGRYRQGNCWRPMGR